MAKVGNITIENAKIVFRNFTGEAKQFNEAGDRNFCVLLADEDAHRLKADGWNVKWLRPREDDVGPQGYLPVSVRFNPYPPKIVMVTYRGKTILGEDSVNILDWADIDNIDLIISPYVWEARGQTGIKAYLKTMYVTIAEDELSAKYDNFPDVRD